MRDLLNLLDNLLTEANLGASEIPAKKKSSVINPDTQQPFSRPELFLHKVQTQSPFTHLNGESVTIDPREANRVAAWVQSGPKGVITLTTTDGGTVKNTDLKKTVEFGSKESEMLPIKGSDVFSTQDIEITDLGNSMQSVLAAGGFPARDMYEMLANNRNLQSLGKLGDAVIYLARQIDQGQVPVFPDDLSAQEIKAIELYASEYLGALGLIKGTVPFVQGSRKDFEKFVGESLEDLVMYFPKSVSNPLADSFSVVNDESGHAIKISSKAAGKGAPPSLTSMKLPPDLRKKYPDAAKFLDVAQDPKFNTFTQPFALLNVLHEINPDSVDSAYPGLLPFDPSVAAVAQDSFKNNKPISDRLMEPFNRRLSEKVQKSSATDGGKVWYAVTKDVMDAVNKGDAVPELQPALIESLGYNFVQLYTNVKDGRLVTEAFWPAKISGQVRLKTKGSAAEPTKGKLSVEISPGGEALPEPGEAPVAAVSAATDADLDAMDAAPRLTGPGARAARTQAAPRMTADVLGRERRR